MISVIAGLVSPIVNKFVDRIPDPNERARAKEELESELVAAANQAMLAQIEVNKQEAAHNSVFVAGWRPFIGWCCGTGVAWAFIVQPIATWVTMIWFPDIVLPEIQTDYLFEMVGGMLGFGGLRTFEKLRGVARK